MDSHAPSNDRDKARLEGEHTLYADQCFEFIDQDVKDIPELRLKAPPIIPRLVVPDSNQSAEHS
jgi:hypothetical protein